MEIVKMEMLKQYLKVRRQEIMSEKDVMSESDSYHNQGHLNIIDLLESKVNKDISAAEIESFMISEMEKSTEFILKIDKDYEASSKDEKEDFVFGIDYFISDGKMCQCLELKNFLKRI